MKPTNNFELWLLTNKPIDQNELYSLYKAVLDEETFDRWEISKINQSLCVRGIDGWLSIANENDKKRFLDLLETFKENKSISLDEWFHIYRLKQR